jgi:succinate dehydrogenase / fumarate reductase iron-sulfur subunit
MKNHININLQINNEKYNLNDVSQEASFLETLDMLNHKPISENRNPIAFDSDCREGICGSCSLVINGIPRG